MSSTMATTAAASRSTAASRPPGIATSPTSSAATITNAPSTGPTSVFQCGWRTSTDCSPTASDRSSPIPDIVRLPARGRALPQVDDVPGRDRGGGGRVGRADQESAGRVDVLRDAGQHAAGREFDPDLTAQGRAGRAVLRQQAGPDRIGV